MYVFYVYLVCLQNTLQVDIEHIYLPKTLIPEYSSRRNQTVTYNRAGYMCRNYSGTFYWVFIIVNGNC